MARVSLQSTILCTSVTLTDYLHAGYADPGADGGLEENLASRGYRSLLGDDDYDSDEY